MKRLYSSWLYMIALIFTVIIFAGCGGTPKVNLKAADGPDLTGAMKYQLWTSYIVIAPVQTKDISKPGVQPEYELQGSVARSPYKPIILMEGRDEFFGSTTITYSPIKNTMMPEKITVAVEDKTEKRIEQAGALLKVALPLAFLEAPSASHKDMFKDDEYMKAVLNFKPWTVNLAPSLDKGKLTEKSASLNESDGIGNNPEGWKYALDIEPVSSTAIDIRTKKGNDLKTFLESLGNQGILVYPSCRSAKLTLIHTKTTKVWTKTCQISDPQWVETVKLPAKGSVMFNECSVAVEPGDLNQPDSMAIAVKLAETAKSVWDSVNKPAGKADPEKKE